LFYYSYEHFRFLNDNGIETRLVIFLRFYQNKTDCLKLLKSKYINVTEKNLIFIDSKNFLNPDIKVIFDNKFNLIMGESHLFHAKNMISSKHYSNIFKMILKVIYKKPLIVIHNERNIEAANTAMKFFAPSKVIFLNDHLVFPHFTKGIEYSKRIYFDIYIKPVMDIKYKFIFNASNDLYYETALKIIEKSDEYQLENLGLIVDSYKDDKYKTSQLLIPIPNLLGIFETFIYSTPIFDNAPRFLQECIYFNKRICYNRDITINDGGKQYYQMGQNGCDFNLSSYPIILDILKDCNA